MADQFYSVPLLKPGTYHRQVAAFRKTLSDNYPPTLLKDLTSPLYDAGLEAAVKQYQQANGLRVTGVTDEPTWAKLLRTKVDFVANYDLENEPQPKGNALLWLAAAGAAFWALS